MGKIRGINSFFIGAASLSLAVFLLCISIMAVLWCKPLYPLYRGELTNPYHLSETEINENYSRLIDYNTRFSISRLNLIKLSMSPEGRQHFVEVRVIFQIILWLMLASGILLFLLAIWNIRRKNLTFLRNGALCALGLPIVLALPLLIDFSSAFTAFHKLFFSNDYWIFDPKKDPVILYLPESFFMKMGLSILGLLLVFAALCILAYQLIKSQVYSSHP